MSATRPATIRTVAERAGVSKSLVSLVLRGSPNVSAAKRQAVQQAIDELGYRPNAIARQLTAAAHQHGRRAAERSAQSLVHRLPGRVDVGAARARACGRCWPTDDWTGARTTRCCRAFSSCGSTV